MKRRDFFFSAPALALAPVSVALPVIACPALSFEERAEEIADLMRQHFRTNLPEGADRYAVTIQDVPGVPAGPNVSRLIGYAGEMRWFLSCGWH